MYIKSPCNWVGNKYKHLDKINEIVGGKEYERVIEPFMGTGNILLNINTPAKVYIGNDNISLVPKLYSFMVDNDFKYDLEELEDIIKAWNSFSDKEDYYVFRNYWNSKYSNNAYDKDFVYETVLLLKMCSNSMVRFNKKGEFNQGFRGLALGKIEFFSNNMKDNIITQLNSLTTALNSRNYGFMVEDFKVALKETTENDLIILDPPYILRTDMYDMNFTEEDDAFLTDFLANTKSDFLYFNYLESNGVINKKMNDLFGSSKHEFLRFENISNKTMAGQGRRGTKKVKEVIITNIGEDDKNE